MKTTDNLQRTYAFTARCDIINMAICAMYVRANSGDKSLVFATRSGVINAIIKAFADMVMTTGEIIRPTVAEAYNFLLDNGLMKPGNSTRRLDVSLDEVHKLEKPATGMQRYSNIAEAVREDIYKHPEYYTTDEDSKHRAEYIKSCYMDKRTLEYYSMPKPVLDITPADFVPQTYEPSAQPPTPIQPSKPSEPSEQIQIPEFIDSDPRLEIDKVIASLATKPKPDK